MKLTEPLIRTYIDEAANVLKECFPTFKKPIISSIKITKARSYWANIRKVGTNLYDIRVSNTFEEIEDSNLFRKRLLSCMIHEQIHTMYGCMNHGKMFKKRCATVNQKFPQYDISSSTLGSEYGVKEIERPIRYIVRCENCGSESKYTRKPGIWAYVNKKNSPYTCCKCGRSYFIGIYLN